MLYYQEKKWDRHRFIYLKIGFVCSLFTVFILISTDYYTLYPLLNTPVREDPHFDLSPLINVKIQTPQTARSKQIKAPKKENFILNVDSSLLIPSTDSLLTKDAKTSAFMNTHSNQGENAAIPVPKIDPPKQTAEEFVWIAERMPLFGDCANLPAEEERIACSNEQVLAFLYEHIKYPKRAVKNGIEGMVIARILVDKEGRIKNPVIIRGIGWDCDEEVLRILNSMPEWSPGRQNGRKVNVQITVPIHFKLK